MVFHSNDLFIFYRKGKVSLFAKSPRSERFLRSVKHKREEDKQSKTDNEKQTNQREGETDREIQEKKEPEKMRDRDRKSR